MPRLFALLTGVKDYHPDSRVTSLTGCVNDVNNIEKYLQKRFTAGDLHIKKLLNEQATRKNFIDTFTAHLISNNDIRPGDMVLFYYSGHGSHAKSNEAFSEWDTEGKDETLVLYDSRCNDGFDLADKELRSLLSRVPAQDNIIVIVDACHSGSITRNINSLDQIMLGQPKHTPARDNDKGRKIADYAGYENLKEGEKAKVPGLRCLSLSACDRTEVAYESSAAPEGMFTAMMVEALNAEAVNISYARLFEHLYTMLKRRARQQTPQLEISGSFDANTVVFDTAVAKTDNIYQVIKDQDGKITVNCGALHGIRNDDQSIKSMSVSISEQDKPNEPAKLVKISAVGLDKSELEPVNLTPKVYQATVLNLPPSVCIYVNGAPEQQKTWEQLAQQKKNASLAFVYKKEDHRDYELQFKETGVILLQHDTGKIIKEATGHSEEVLQYLLKCCNKICDWHLLLGMHNHAVTEKSYEEKFETTFGIEVKNAAGEWELQPKEIVLYLDEQQKQVPVSLQLTTQSEKGWFCGVFYMNSRFGIEKLTDPVNESKLSKAKPLKPFPDGAALTLRDGVDEATDYIKLVISKEPFKDFLIQQFRGFEKENNEFARGGTRDFVTPEKIDQDWYAVTLSIKIVRRSGKLDADKNFTSGKLTIHQHQSLSGKASVSAISTHAKSIHPADELRQFIQENGLELVNLNTTKSAMPASVVWVDAMNGQVTKENPLKITVNEIPAENEGLAALTMEDGIIQVIGLGSPDEKAGNYNIEIPALPEDQQRKKNLVRAAWFCFVKVVLGKDLSKLRKVNYENGKVEYDDHIAGIVTPGSKVAVCIHGIIGETKAMAASMEFLLKEKNYDLVLAFDYENLNKEIGKMAETFKELLMKAGVSKDAPVDIVSHSMGGLVSRFMIEQLDGGELVRRLFMFGTPNAGSVLGDIPKIRDWTVTVLTLACNYGGAYLGAVGPVLSAINKVLAVTKPATNSLAQMAVGSKFYILLNGKPAKPIATQYHIIAGNVLEFEPGEDSSRFAKIMEKVKRQVGELLYRPPVKNDIAVGVESIFTLPDGITATKKEIPGHHMNYFVLKNSMDYFKTLV